jgi:prepilin-type N-terminal cleavage/methylation domain-containing protein
MNIFYRLTQRIRIAAGDQRGFTLTEVLVACLILGLLATMAIPAFLKRRNDAGDAAAKGLVNTAQQTAASYGTVNGYAGMNPAALNAIESSINTAVNGKAVLVNANPTGNGYLLTVVSSTADTFNLTYANGSVTRSCLVAAGNGDTSSNTGGGCNHGSW